VSWNPGRACRGQRLYSHRHGVHERKRRRNLAERGIDFFDVLVLLDAAERVEFKDVRINYGETRFVILCPVDGRLFHVTYTMRARTGGSSPHARRAGGSSAPMSDIEPVTKAVLTTDGRVLVEQPDGTIVLPRGGRTGRKWIG
jgi:uncharacterized DUF497 family protein